MRHSVGDQFGISVSVNGNAALVGAESHDLSGLSRLGAAYVYRFDGTMWTEEQKLLASDGSSCDFFGSAVSLCGDTTVVGAESDTPSGQPGSGSAYIFRFDGSSWGEEQKLIQSDPTRNQGFGCSISVNEGVIVVGSPDQTGNSPGAAYVFPVPQIGGLRLHVTPATASVGDTLTISTCDGVPGNLAILFVVAVNGSPFFRPVASATLDAAGNWVMTATVPNEPNLPGSDVTLRIFTIDGFGNIVQSNDETVSFQ